MSLKNTTIVTIALLFISIASAQRNYNDYNRLGITGGATFFDIQTDQLITEQGSGFAGGFTARGAFRNDFDLIYGLSFMSSAIGIQGTFLNDTQFIDYEIQGVQLQFIGSYNIIKNHLSIEAGPLLNVSGKMKLKRESQADYIIDGYTLLRADEIQNISPINFRVLGGLTFGLESFRLTAHYQYGVTNMLNRLNDEGLEETNFQGNSSTIFAGAVFYF